MEEDIGICTEKSKLILTRCLVTLQHALALVITVSFMTHVSLDMEQHEAGDVSVGHRALGPDLVADAGGGFHCGI